MTDEIRFLGDLQRLELKDGDILVLTTPLHLPPESVRRLRASVEALIPGHKVVVLGDGLKLGVLEAA